ncbi:MAG: ankyrin repeat domain-containing protein [Bacteroidota bacterium]
MKNVIVYFALVFFSSCWVQAVSWKSKKRYKKELSLLHACSIHNNLTRVEALLNKSCSVAIQDRWGYTPLYWAIRNDNEVIVEILYAKNAPLYIDNTSEYHPLHVAADFNSIKVANWLLVHVAADFNSINVANWLPEEKMGHANSRSKWGETPLHRAAYWGQLAVALLLIDCRANVNAQMNDDTTPLHQAAYRGHLDLVTLLIHYGAILNAQTVSRETALHHALEASDVAVAALLIQHGANPYLKRLSHPQTAFEMIQKETTMPPEQKKMLVQLIEKKQKNNADPPSDKDLYESGLSDIEDNSKGVSSEKKSQVKSASLPIERANYHPVTEQNKPLHQHREIVIDKEKLSRVINNFSEMHEKAPQFLPSTFMVVKEEEKAAESTTSEGDHLLNLSEEYSSTTSSQTRGKESQNKQHQTGQIEPLLNPTSENEELLNQSVSMAKSGDNSLLKYNQYDSVKSIESWISDSRQLTQSTLAVVDIPASQGEVVHSPQEELSQADVHTFEQHNEQEKNPSQSKLQEESLSETGSLKGAFQATNNYLSQESTIYDKGVHTQLLSSELASPGEEEKVSHKIENIEAANDEPIKQSAGSTIRIEQQTSYQEKKLTPHELTPPSTNPNHQTLVVSLMTIGSMILACCAFFYTSQEQITYTSTANPSTKED